MFQVTEKLSFLKSPEKVRKTFFFQELFQEEITQMPAFFHAISSEQSQHGPAKGLLKETTNVKQVLSSLKNHLLASVTFVSSLDAKSENFSLTSLVKGSLSRCNQLHLGHVQKNEEQTGIHLILLIPVPK